MKKVSVLSLVFLVSACLQAADAPARLLQFDARVADLGRLQSGTKKQQTFSFSNPGTVPVTIHEAKASCGCIHVVSVDKTIAPGGKGELVVELTAQGNGKRQESVVLHTSAPAERQFAVWVRAEFYEAVRITPAAAEFGTVDKNAFEKGKAVREIVLENVLEKPLVLGEPIAQLPGFDAQLKEVEAGRKFVLSVRISDVLQEGHNLGVFALRTNQDDPQTVYVTARAYVPKPVDVEPARIVAPFKVDGEDVVRPVSVKHLFEPGLTISDLQTGNPNVTADVITADNQNFIISVRFKKGFMWPVAGGMKLTFRTSDPARKEVVIPILSPASVR